MISALEKNTRFLSDDELQAILIDVPPALSQKIMRINEIFRIQAIRASLWGLVISAIFGIIGSIFLPPEILVSKEE